MSVPATPLISSLQESLLGFSDIPASEREAAFANFLRVGLPTQRLDAWKYTDLRRLASREFKISTVPAAKIDATILLSVSCSQRIIFVDGIFDAELSLVPSVAGITTRITRRPTTTGTQITALNPVALSAFELLNTALRTDTTEIAFDANGMSAPTIYVAYVWSDASSGAMSHPHLAVSVAGQSSARLIEHHIGLNAGANFSNKTTSITLSKHAELLHVRIQEDAATNFVIENTHIDVAAQAHYQSHQYVIGAGLSRSDIDVQLTGAESHAELHGLLLAQKSEHVDVRICMDHRAPNTRSGEDFRGIADGRGRVIFNGKVIVRPDAQKTDARQSSRNLLLSPTAEIDARPELEIYANDVQCAHGATVGQLDANALFYLRSRGLDSDEARALLTHAFAAELLERLPDADLREYILRRLMLRLGSRAPQL